MYRFIPNFLTALNLLSGCIGIVMVFQENVLMASYLIWLAAFFDFLDGMAARVLSAYSPIGLQLDSLADVVSFGCLPAFIMFDLISIQLDEQGYLAYGAFLVAIFSAFRLAKFNVDERQGNEFYGIPTPANALLYSALPLIYNGSDQISFLEIFRNPFFLIGFVIITSVLLVVEVRMLNLKFKNLHWYPNRFRYIFIALALVLLIFLNVNAIPLIYIGYIILSLLSNRYLYYG